jgi:hypothetical protein
VFKILVPRVCKFGPCGCPGTDYTSLLSLFFNGFKLFQFSVIPLVGILVAYFISSFFVTYFNPSKEIKARIKQGLKPTKARLILSILGWVTVGTTFMHYVSGVYGGIMNFPPSLQSLYSVSSLVEVILFPFTAVNYLVFFNVTTLLIHSFLFFIKVPISITNGGPNPESLTGIGAVVIFTMLIVEWYLFSCYLVGLYNRIRNRKISKK